MKFKDITSFGNIMFGDMSGQVVYTDITVPVAVTSLEGAPLGCNNFDASYSRITTLKYAPKRMNKGNLSLNGCKNLESLECDYPITIDGDFNCSETFIKDEDLIKQIVKYRIKAKNYYLSRAEFTFSEIKDQFDLDKGVKSKGFRTLLGLKNEI